MPGLLRLLAYHAEPVPGRRLHDPPAPHEGDALRAKRLEPRNFRVEIVGFDVQVDTRHRVPPSAAAGRARRRPTAVRRTCRRRPGRDWRSAAAARRSRTAAPLPRDRPGSRSPARPGALWCAAFARWRTPDSRAFLDRANGSTQKRCPLGACITHQRPRGLPMRVAPSASRRVGLGVDVVGFDVQVQARCVLDASALRYAGRPAACRARRSGRRRLRRDRGPAGPGPGSRTRAPRRGRRLAIDHEAGKATCHDAP